MTTGCQAGQPDANWPRHRGLRSGCVPSMARRAAHLRSQIFTSRNEHGVRSTTTSNVREPNQVAVPVSRATAVLVARSKRFSTEPGRPGLQRMLEMTQDVCAPGSRDQPAWRHPYWTGDCGRNGLRCHGLRHSDRFDQRLAALQSTLPYATGKAALSASRKGLATEIAQTSRWS